MLKDSTNRKKNNSLFTAISSFAVNVSTIRQGVERLARAWEAYQEKGAIITRYPSPIV